MSSLYEILLDIYIQLDIDFPGYSLAIQMDERMEGWKDGWIDDG